MTIQTAPQDGEAASDALHSDTIPKTFRKGSPAYNPALQRYIALGLTEEEAATLLT